MEILVKIFNFWQYDQIMSKKIMADIAFVSFVRLDMKGQVEPNTLNFEIWCLTQCALGMLQIFEKYSRWSEYYTAYYFF